MVQWLLLAFFLEKPSKPKLDSIIYFKNVFFITLQLKLNQAVNQMIDIDSTFHSAIKIRIATSPDFITVDPSQFSLYCSFPSKLLQEQRMVELHASKIVKKEKKIELKGLQLREVTDGQESCQKLVIGGGKKNLFSIFQYEIRKQKNSLFLQYHNGAILNFCSVTKPKFAKTSKLQNLLQGIEKQTSGALSMDQTGRLLLQSKKCDFPVLGIWSQCSNIDSIQAYQVVSEFLHTLDYEEKIYVTNRQQKYIYFVQIREGQMPQSFLVSWEYSKDSTKTFTQEYLLNDEVNMCLGKDSLEFTLRCPRKQSVTNPENSASTGINFTSPQKQLTNEEFVEQLEKFHLAESPQFSSIKKNREVHNWEEQCYHLRDKVLSQEKQINSLQYEVKRLRKQIIFMRQAASSPSQKFPITFKSPSYDLGSSTPRNQKPKKLSESDLYIEGMKNINSISTKQKKSLGQSNSSSGGKWKKREISQEWENEQEPWDNFQLIEEPEY